jgi:hypothetical protein
MSIVIGQIEWPSLDGIAQYACDCGLVTFLVVGLVHSEPRADINVSKVGC